MVATEPVIGAAFAPLGLLELRAGRAVVGRSTELAAIRDGIAATAQGRLAAVTVEGEPGIGKTRLLLAARELAADRGFLPVAVGADEELRGPFLLTRSIVGSPEVREAVAGTASEAAVTSAAEALTGRDDPAFAALSPDERLLRSFDLATMAVRALTADRPLALLIDDLQWADEDSLRLLRYVIRTEGGSPIFFLFSIRPEELSLVNEAVTLIADMERMRVVKRLKISRFSPVETAEYLEQVLGGPVDVPTASTIHGQAEGVPFIVEEIARAYREAGMLQQVGDRWTLTRNADRLAPSAVRTLIQRRAAHLPGETKTSLAEAAILGRHFSLKDLAELRGRLGDDGPADPIAIGDSLGPAVAAGLLVEQPEAAPADYSFPHEQVRDFAADTLPPARRRAIHKAIVELLLSGDPAPETLPLLAHHARAAGDAAVCVRFSTDAAKAALAAHAPEEVLRVVEVALPSAATPQDRLALLTSRDDALAMLRRPAERLEGLAELAALAEATGDPHLDLDVTLRRAAALRLSGEEDRAGDLARRVRASAAEQGDRRAELAACVELGQALLGAGMGEGFVPSPMEADLDGALEAYERALAIAEELGDTATVAGATRELGVVELGRIRAWFVERVLAGEHLGVMQAVAGGATLEDISATLPIAPMIEVAGARLHRALELFEGLGDRQGMMASIIAMAYLSWGPDIHLGSDAARHIEEIRRLATQKASFSSQSQRAFAEVQMLYGVHVFSVAKVIPDLALSRGREAYEQARAIGDRHLEFLAAGGVARVERELGDLDEAAAWIDRAAAAASESPTPLRARRLELWRGELHAARGDASGMREHLERAAQMAIDQGSPAGRCEALTVLAVEAARLGAERGDEELLALAERSAEETKSLARSLTGHPPWAAKADAALAAVALARGQTADAVASALAAGDALQAALHEDLSFDILIPAAEAIVAGGSDEDRARLQQYLRLQTAMVANRVEDESVRARWFRGPVGSAVARLAAVEGDGQRNVPADERLAHLDDDETVLLELVAKGFTNQEIATKLGVDHDEIERHLSQIYAKIGASSRADATVFAFQTRML
jgi:DNA-binding NarL/FixJ family response regulator